MRRRCNIPWQRWKSYPFPVLPNTTTASDHIFGAFNSSLSLSGRVYPIIHQTSASDSELLQLQIRLQSVADIIWHHELTHPAAAYSCRRCPVAENQRLHNSGSNWPATVCAGFPATHNYHEVILRDARWCTNSSCCSSSTWMNDLASANCRVGYKTHQLTLPSDPTVQWLHASNVDGAPTQQQYVPH